MLGRRGFPLERAAAQICREGGAWVMTAAFDALDNRRLEVVADGLTLWRNSHRTPRWCLPCAGTGPPDPGQLTTTARLWKMLAAGKRPLTSEEGGKALVVLAAVVGREWRVETAQFLTARPVPRRCRWFSKAGLRQHGCDVEAQSWRARLPGPSQCRCWTGVRSLAQVKKSF